MIRAARAIDRPALVALLQEGFRRSRYSSLGNVSVKHAEDLLLGAILKHGVKAVDGTHCMVVERRGEIAGLHFGMKQRVYLIGDKFSATDLFYYVRPGSPFDAVALLESFIAWAESDPRVVEIQPGTTDAVQDWRIAGHLYEKRGFEQCGAIFRRHTKKRAA